MCKPGPSIFGFDIPYNTPILIRMCTPYGPGDPHYPALPTRHTSEVDLQPISQSVGLVAVQSSYQSQVSVCAATAIIIHSCPCRHKMQPPSVLCVSKPGKFFRTKKSFAVTAVYSVGSGACLRSVCDEAGHDRSPLHRRPGWHAPT